MIQVDTEQILRGISYGGRYACIALYSVPIAFLFSRTLQAFDCWE
jgi:hypothetical protein